MKQTRTKFVDGFVKVPLKEEHRFTIWLKQEDLEFWKNWFEEKGEEWAVGYKPGWGHALFLAKVVGGDEDGT